MLARTLKTEPDPEGTGVGRAETEAEERIERRRVAKIMIESKVVQEVEEFRKARRDG